jgi:hypothetical protein
MMPEPLTPERFTALAEAYGGIARWPEEFRVEGWAMAERWPELAKLLTEAEALDARLDRWTVAPPSPALRNAVIARQQRSTLRRARAWWAGLGIATALAGATAGSIATAAVPSPHPSVEDSTAFGDVSGQED